MRRKTWTGAEHATLAKHYATLGAAGMLQAGYLADRPVGSITKQANLRGLRFHAPTDDSELSPVPRMDLLESLACVSFRKWGGPATPGLVGARLVA